MLKMIRTIIIKFPTSVLDDQSQDLFMHLVISLTNDQDKDVRSKTGTAIKTLACNISPHKTTAIINYTIDLYLSSGSIVRASAAQVNFSELIFFPNLKRT